MEFIKAFRDFQIDEDSNSRPVEFLLLWIETAMQCDIQKGYKFYEDIRTEWFNEVLKMTNQLN